MIRVVHFVNFEIFNGLSMTVAMQKQTPSEEVNSFITAKNIEMQRRGWAPSLEQEEVLKLEKIIDSGRVAFDPLRALEGLARDAGTKGTEKLIEDYGDGSGGSLRNNAFRELGNRWLALADAVANQIKIKES